MWRGLLAAAVVLVCLGVIAVTYVVPKIRVQQQSTASGDRVRVETPFGSVRVDARDNMNADLSGVPVYPAAERVSKEKGGAVVDIDWGTGEKHLSVSGAEYTTADPVAQVFDWYRQKLPGWEIHNGDLMRVENGTRRVIAVKVREGKTHIGIAVIGEPAVN